MPHSLSWGVSCDTCAVPPCRYMQCTLGASSEVLMGGGHLRDVPGFESSTNQRFSRGVHVLEEASIIIVVMRLDVGVRAPPPPPGGAHFALERHRLEFFDQHP